MSCEASRRAVPYLGLASRQLDLSARLLTSEGRRGLTGVADVQIWHGGELWLDVSLVGHPECSVAHSDCRLGNVPSDPRGGQTLQHTDVDWLEGCEVLLGHVDQDA